MPLEIVRNDITKMAMENLKSITANGGFKIRRKKYREDDSSEYAYQD